MMGEGKLSLFNGAEQSIGWEPSKLTCVICSRIAINTNEETLDKVDVNEYMKSNSKFKDLVSSPYHSIPENFESTQQSSTNKVEFSTKSSSEYAVVFSQIAPKDLDSVLSNLGTAGVAISGATFATPIIGKAFLATTPGLVVMGITAAGVTAYSMANVHHGQVASAGYCGPFTSRSADAEKGCSTIQIVPYEVKTVNAICEQIDGSP